MKKLLLLAATALIGFSSAFAEVKYVAGTGIKDPSELQDGGLYFLHAYFSTTRTREGFITGIGTNTNGQYAKYAGNFINAIPTEGTTNTNYIWKIVGTPEGFKVQCVGAGGNWLSRRGAVDIAKNNIKGVSSPDNVDVGIYALETIPTDADYNHSTEEHTRFWFRLTNGTWPGTTDVYPCLMSNGPADNGGCENVAYWNYNGSPAGYLQIELIPAIAHDGEPLAVTVHLPQINGTDVADHTLNLYANENVETPIQNMLSELGGMANASISGQNGTLIVGEGNTEFTVTGTWDRELIANHLYRICLKPNDSPAAMRYDVMDEGRVKTVVDGLQSLNRLVPERLWYFKPVEGKANVYTLHTMADTEKGIYIEDCHDKNEHIAYATLSDDTHAPTEFTVGASTWGQAMIGDIYISYGENNRNFLNDRSHYLANWTNAAAIGNDGSAMRLYPITDDDLTTLGVTAGTEPTVDNLAQAVADFNATNVNAALRRLGYMISNSDLIGPYVGQYNNPEGNALEKYQEALALADDATDEEKAEIVAALDVEKLIYTDLLPNRYYRFKNKFSGLYISSISSYTNTNGRSYMDLTEDGKRSNTVFYLNVEGNDSTLVCFDNGLVMPSFNGSSWIPVLKTDADAATHTTLTSQHNGRYVIHVSSAGNAGHRHLYGGADVASGKSVDCAGNETGEKYQWYIEPVKELPITLYNVINIAGYDNDGWTSIYSPVALEIPANSHLTAYTGNFVDGQLVEPTKACENGIIPANQTTILFYDGEGEPTGSLMESREHISYMYLPIAYDYVEEGVQEAGNLNAGIYAIAKEEGKKYFTLHESHSNNFREYTGDFIPGFKAYIAEQTESAAEFYPITLHPEKLSPALEAITVEKHATEDGQFNVTISLGYADCELYFKHSIPEPEVEKARRRITDHTGYDKATANGDNTHTFTVPAGVINYYGYHPETDSKGIERTITIDGDGIPTSINGIAVNGADRAACYDLQGRRLAAPAKGINIINNKKVLVK